jgi:hypothetical protein
LKKIAAVMMEIVTTGMRRSLGALFETAGVSYLS